MSETSHHSQSQSGEMFSILNASCTLAGVWKIDTIANHNTRIQLNNTQIVKRN